jgi:cytochrome c553
MKRILTLALICLASAGFAAAQNAYSPSTDVLGAHLNYGRGCAACHAPHSGAYGNGNAATADPTSGNVALWGEDVGSLYGKSLSFGGGSFPETLPSSMSNSTPDVSGLLTCLSCHDGNYATGAMMKNAVYETLPSTYGKLNTIPTLLGNDKGTVGNYLNDHPVGLAASVSCGGTHNWDCTETNGVISMTGTHSAQFVTNYGFFVSLSAYQATPTSTFGAVVMCTSCHNQHLMNVVSITASTKSGLPQGYYQTMFFIRAPYNPGSTTAGSNMTAQFCRQCHGGESNEMNNGTAVTTF